MQTPDEKIQKINATLKHQLGKLTEVKDLPTALSKIMEAKKQIETVRAPDNIYKDLKFNIYGHE